MALSGFQKAVIKEGLGAGTVLHVGPGAGRECWVSKQKAECHEDRRKDGRRSGRERQHRWAGEGFSDFRKRLWVHITITPLKEARKRV